LSIQKIFKDAESERTISHHLKSVHFINQESE